jgi:multiple sugar transport system substrate-binding protein
MPGIKVQGGIWGVVLLAIGLAVAGAGCSRATACPNGKTCLRYMAWGNPEQLEVEREMVSDFNAQNPDLHVKLFTVPGSSYGQKMTTMLVSGTAPDVLRVDHYAFPSMQKKGYFVDLTDFAENDPKFNKSDFYPATIEEGTVNGRLYGLNALFGGIIIYYNKKLYKEAGLEDPYESYKKGTWTWEKFRANAKALTKFKDGKPQVFGTDIPQFPMTAPVIWAHGGELLNEDFTESRISSPGAIKAYQFLADLVWKDKVSATPAQGANAAFTFESGKLAMTMNWMGMTPRFRTLIKDFEWDLVPMPSASHGGSTILKGNQLVVAKNSKHPEAAWRFIKFLTSYETEIKLYAVIRRCFPTRIAVAESDTFLNSDVSPRNPRAFIDSVESGRPLPINERWSEWLQVLNSELDNLMAGREKSAEVVLSRAHEKINKVLSEEPGF